MPQKNPWGTVVKVEHEKVEDASPDVWLQAACKSIDSGDYNKALEQIAKGRQLDVGGQYLFLFDLLDIINYYNLSMPEKAHRIKISIVIKILYLLSTMIVDMILLSHFMIFGRLILNLGQIYGTVAWIIYCHGMTFLQFYNIKRYR